jgi:hypothetical protein
MDIESKKHEPVKMKLSCEMDLDTRVKCFLQNWVAVDEQCGTLDRESKVIHMRRSNGRRRTGRPAKYWIMGTGLIKTPEILSYSDAEALEIANNILSIPWEVLTFRDLPAEDSNAPKN